MEKLAAYFRSVGGDANKVFAELNEQGNPTDGSTGSTFTQEISSESGLLTCIENGKVVVDSDPKNLGKDLSNIFTTQKKEAFLPFLIKELRKNPKKEDVVTYALKETNIPNPANNAELLSEKYVVVAKGRKSLLGDKLNKQHHEKFV